MLGLYVPHAEVGSPQPNAPGFRMRQHGRHRPRQYLVDRAADDGSEAFQRGWIESSKVPEAAGLAWCCSCNDIDWRANGFDGRSLGWLLAQSGYFHGAHRAEDDVDAVIQILRQNMPDGTTALAQMLTTARAPSWRFRAVGASFEVKDLLRLRGYRWDAASNPKCWWREVPDARRAEEEWWLASHVYSMEANPRALGPIIERLTWRERYAPTVPSNRLA